MADTGWHIRQSGTIGCEQRSDAEQIVYLPPTRDVRSLLREWVISGRCIILAGGAESLRSSGLPTLRTYSSIAGRSKDRTVTRRNEPPAVAASAGQAFYTLGH
jgi:hypothetical protein